MLLRVPFRAKRTLIIAVTALVAAALAIVPWQARAEVQPAGFPFAFTNLTVQVTQQSAGSGNTTFRFRVLNNGEDDLVDGDYQLVLDWSVGRVVPRSGDTPCSEVTEHGCVFEGRAVEFFEGPISGPGSVDYRVTLGGLTDGFFVVIKEINFTERVVDFPDFGLQPPIFCLANNCSST